MPGLEVLPRNQDLESESESRPGLLRLLKILKEIEQYLKNKLML